MLNLSREQIDDRYDSLPEILKDALWSVATVDEIDRISNSNHLEDKKASRMAKITGYVIMGFLHPDDLRRELQEVLNIDIRVAASLSRDINKKILSPIIEDIRKVYTPVISEIRKTPMPSLTWPAAPIGETLKREVSTEGLKIPASIPPPVPAAGPAKPLDKAQGGPFILHEEESLKPVLETRKPATESIFFKSLPQDAGFQKPAGAKLEFGKPFGEAPAEGEARQGRQGREAPRIVNYSDLRTPLTQPSATSSPSQISEKLGRASQPPANFPLTTPPKTELPMPQKPPVTPPPTLPVQKQQTPLPQPSMLKPPATQPPTPEKKPENPEEKVIDLRSFKIIQ